MPPINTAVSTGGARKVCHQRLGEQHRQHFRPHRITAESPLPEHLPATGAVNRSGLHRLVRRWRMSAQNGRWKDRMSQSDLDAVDRGIPAIAPRGKSSHETLRWREMDSNYRFRVGITGPWGHGPTRIDTSPSPLPTLWLRRRTARS
jgi:hypothetical protein